MSCTCSIDNYDDGGFVACYSEKLVTSRKEHKCLECRRVIHKGEKYLLAKGLFDGDWFRVKICQDCQSICETFFCSRAFECMVDDLKEYIENQHGVIPSECMDLLTPGAKEMVIGLVDKYIKSENKENK